MFIRQNMQISLAFLKKIGRISKSYADRFKELLTFISQIESNNYVQHIKRQILKAFIDAKEQVVLKTTTSTS